MALMAIKGRANPEVSVVTDPQSPIRSGRLPLVAPMTMVEQQGDGCHQPQRDPSPGPPKLLGQLDGDHVMMSFRQKINHASGRNTAQ